MALTNDPVELANLDLEHATRDLIDGVYRLVLVGGPPGIGKSRRALEVLREYATEKQKAWALLSDEDKLEDERRRTRVTKDGLAFVSPVRLIPGGNRSEASLFTHLYYCSFPGEIGVLDDAPAILFKRSQELVNDACDEERGGRVSSDLKNLWVPSDFYFRGGLMVIHNLTAAEVEKLFHARVRSRARFVEFPTDPELLFKYIYNQAIRKKSLMPFLTAMAIPSLGPARGLGLSTAEAEAVLREIGDFYIQNRERVKEHSFRTLREWATDRARYPQHWKRRAERKMRPWA